VKRSQLFWLVSLAAQLSTADPQRLRYLAEALVITRNSTTIRHPVLRWLCSKVLSSLSFPTIGCSGSHLLCTYTSKHKTDTLKELFSPWLNPEHAIGNEHNRSTVARHIRCRAQPLRVLANGAVVHGGEPQNSHQWLRDDLPPKMPALSGPRGRRCQQADASTIALSRPKWRRARCAGFMSVPSQTREAYLLFV
jgi:hypothetical protein